jgi:hypothetical protein
VKFGNIVFARTGRLTIGDEIQLLAIENLYKTMGIDYSTVIRLEFSQLHNYNGEEVILPISFPLYGLYKGKYITKFSEKIIPVFLGLSLLSPIIVAEDIEYLKKYEPIGCRDQYTVNILRNYNICAYLFGCITQTFPFKRVFDTDKYRNVYCIDVDDELKDEIPQHILRDCKFTSHTYYVEKNKSSTEQLAREVYDMYIKDAKLVITSRLHAALPCAAAGIPVIWAKDKYSFRFVGNDLFLKVYTKEEYKNIDWNPLPVKFESHKLMMIDHAKCRILGEYNSEFIHQGKKKTVENYHIEFIDNTESFIMGKWNKMDRVNFAVWGATQTALAIVGYLKDYYPNSVFEGFIDRDPETRFMGREPQKKEWIMDKEDIFVFVCTGAAIRESTEFFSVNNIKNFYHCCIDGNVNQ